MHSPRTSARPGIQIFHAAVLLLLIGGAAYSARAGTFVVTSVADPGDGTCTAAEIGDGCTLREAITAANVVGGVDTVDATGVSGTIGLTAALPDLSGDITILGPGATLLAVSRETTARFRIFTVLSAVTVNISGVSVTGGRTADGVDGSSFGGSGDSGGGIYNSGSLTITGCKLSGNQTGKGGAGGHGYGGDGGGIYNTGTLTIVESTVSGNQTGSGGAGRPGGGGGLPGGTGGHGGGIFNRGSATVVNSTISGNRTGNGATGPFSNNSIPGLGGGIYHHDAGQMTISNSTISGNETGTLYVDGPSASITGGGGIYLRGGQMTISNSTIIANRATLYGGGIHRYSGAFSSEIVTLRSTIVANNSASADGSDIFGTVQSDGYNLIKAQSGANITPNPAAGPDFYGSPQLGSLADNGGPTLTHLPLNDSPAIDKGKNFSVSSTDQRGLGFPRQVDLPDTTYPNAGDATDIGAVERAQTATATPTPMATATPTPTATPPGSLVLARNISTRARIDTGDHAIIAGFIITGSAQKKVVVRGLGPSLQEMNVAGFVADPVLELRGSSGALILYNDNWQDDPAQAAQIQATSLAPTRGQESAIVLTLAPGTYTAIVRGRNNTTGVGLVEVYDIDNSESKLANLSTRGFVQLQENVMIGGFTLGGAGNPTRIAVRALGPSLSNFGLSNVLQDPTLELRNGNGTLMVANDNWTDDAASAAQLTDNGLALPDAYEAGIFAGQLPAGQFTAVVASKNGGVGIALVEIYNLE